MIQDGEIFARLDQVYLFIKYIIIFSLRREINATMFVGERHDYVS
jgi:hypothetical protein